MKGKCCCVFVFALCLLGWGGFPGGNGWAHAHIQFTFWVIPSAICMMLKLTTIVYKHRHNKTKAAKSMPPSPAQPQASSASSTSAGLPAPPQDWKVVEVRV